MDPLNYLIFWVVGKTAPLRFTLTGLLGPLVIVAEWGQAQS